MRSLRTGHEKKGGAPRSARQMNGFQEIMDICSLLKMDSVGPKYTWRGFMGGEEILVKLDRFMPNSTWLDLFPLSRDLNLNPSKSDHLPILIEIREARLKKKRKKKKFHFEEFWLRDENCRKIVESSWNISSDYEPFSKICCKIRNTRFALQEWSKDRFGLLRNKIESTRGKLAYFFDTSVSAAPSEDKLCLESKLNELLHQEQIFWKQRAKIFWLTEGDMNTKFFHLV